MVSEQPVMQPRTLYQKVHDLPAVFIDGALYVGVAVFAFLQTAFSGDEAAKYITPPVVLFWIKVFLGTGAAATLSVKLYRSTAYADHQLKKAHDQKEANDTARFYRGQPASNEPPAPKVPVT